MPSAVPASTLLLSGLSPRDGRMRTIRDMDVHEHLEEGQFFVDADRALEFAEDRLLATLAPTAAEGVPLPLEKTLFGTGLDANELAVLRNLLTERHVPRGEAVFRSGEPGNAMYVLLAGQIGIWLPGSDRDSRIGA